MSPLAYDARAGEWRMQNHPPTDPHRRIRDLRTVLEAVEETGLIEGHLARVIERTLNTNTIAEETT